MILMNGKLDEATIAMELAIENGTDDVDSFLVKCLKYFPCIVFIN